MESGSSRRIKKGRRGLRRKWVRRVDGESEGERKGEGRVQGH